MNGSTTQFTPWGGDAYQSDIYRGGVDAIARNCAKLKGSHVISYGDHTKAYPDGKLNRLLQVHPNPYMSAYDALYKLVTHYYLYNNSFAYLQKDEKQNITGIYPVGATNVEFMVDASGVMYCRFLFRNGKTATLPYSDIIHLRRHFNENDLLGNSNDALIPALQLAHTQSEGILNGIKSSANIRGILKYTQIMAPEKLKAEKEKFIADYLDISNDGGVVVLDEKTTYEPIAHTPATIDGAQLEAVKTKVYNYLGITEKIVNSSYSEDEWAAFYESVIEPLAVQLSLEFTRKVFNDREQAFGNSIMFESGRLQFSSNATKVNLIKELVPYGLLTINQALEILNLPGVEDGDKRLQTLNMVDATKANQYQLGGTADEGA